MRVGIHALEVGGLSLNRLLCTYVTSRRLSSMRVECKICTAVLFRGRARLCLLRQEILQRVRLATNTRVDAKIALLGLNRLERRLHAR